MLGSKVASRSTLGINWTGEVSEVAAIEFTMAALS